MPNYVANIVTFDGDKERIKEMLSAIQNDEFGPGSISFNKIIPMPPELDIKCGRSKTDPQVIRNIQKYGAPNWYAGGYEEGGDYSQCDKLAFRTAWQEPVPVIYERQDFLGVLKDEHMPDWAREKLAEKQEQTYEQEIT